MLPRPPAAVPPAGSPAPAQPPSPGGRPSNSQTPSTSPAEPPRPTRLGILQTRPARTSPQRPSRSLSCPAGWPPPAFCRRAKALLPPALRPRLPAPPRDGSSGPAPILNSIPHWPRRPACLSRQSPPTPAAGAAESSPPPGSFRCRSRSASPARPLRPDLLPPGSPRRLRSESGSPPRPPDSGPPAARDPHARSPRPAPSPCRCRRSSRTRIRDSWPDTLESPASGSPPAPKRPGSTQTRTLFERSLNSFQNSSSEKSLPLHVL